MKASVTMLRPTDRLAQNVIQTSHCNLDLTPVLWNQRSLSNFLKTWEYHGIPRFTTQDVGRNPASLQNVVFDGLCVPNVAEHPPTYLRVAPILSNHIPPYPCFFKFHAHFNTFFQMVSKPIWKPLGEVSSVPASR